MEDKFTPGYSGTNSTTAQGNYLSLVSEKIVALEKKVYEAYQEAERFKEDAFRQSESGKKLRSLGDNNKLEELNKILRKVVPLLKESYEELNTYHKLQNHDPVTII